MRFLGCCFLLIFKDLTSGMLHIDQWTSALYQRDFSSVGWKATEHLGGEKQLNIWNKELSHKQDPGVVLWETTPKNGVSWCLKAATVNEPPIIYEARLNRVFKVGSLRETKVNLKWFTVYLWVVRTYMPTDAEVTQTNCSWWDDTV